MAHSPRRGDTSQVAWAVVQEATRQAEPAKAQVKDPAAVARRARGRIGAFQEPYC